MSPTKGGLLSEKCRFAGVRDDREMPDRSCGGYSTKVSEIADGARSSTRLPDRIGTATSASPEGSARYEASIRFGQLPHARQRTARV